MAKTRRQGSVTEGSGNVFADLGFAEPEEELAKAHLLMLLQQAIKRRRLTQARAAAITGIDQPDFSALLNGRAYAFSTGQMMRMLTRLGQDLDITVRAAARHRMEGRIRVVDKARI